ncbi:MAG: YciI family protein [Rhodanobacter sp.]|uniref:YciI family protein n=1 Tax=Rhodanobacter sp. KK11 TaxID=3083255 RepID=UPI0029674FC9|nr:YciI family protein [Rhodanobacter sp. KK11]MDW2980942.1 YciI family protein [Rhodanobacter sp. KK11]
MRFMMWLIPAADEGGASGNVHDADGVAAMAQYNQALWRAGVLLALDGLCPPSTGARVFFADGRPALVDGPRSGTMGAPAGYWMIDVASLDEAIAWALRCPAAAGETIELQRVQEFADLAADVQQALTRGIDGQADDADRDALCRRPVAVP